MKLQTRLSLILLLISLAAISLVAYQADYSKKRLLALLGIEMNVRKDRFDRLVRMQSNDLSSLVKDYTYWTDMAEFVKNRDPQWARLNLEAALKTFNADASWVYDAQGNLVYYVTRFQGHPDIDAVAPGTDIGGLFRSKKLIRFFTGTKYGPMEVYAASIHTTEDFDRKGESFGFLFSGRIWNKEYVEAISRLLESSISITADPAADGKEGYGFDKDLAWFTVALRSWDLKPVAYARIESRSVRLQFLDDFTRKNIARDVAFSILLVLLLFLTFFLWVNRPLSRISSALRTNSTAPLGALKANNDEFAELARLVEKSFEQSQLLNDEIAARQNAEEILADSRQRMLDIIDFFPDAVFAIDKNRTIIAWNKAIEKLTGILARDMIGKGDYEYAIPFYKERRPILVDLALENNEEIAKKYSFVRREGNTLTAEVRIRLPGRDADTVLWGIASVLYDSKGNIAGAIESTRDITEYKLNEQKLRSISSQALSSSTAKSEFIANMSHEIRTPMNAIIGFTDLMFTTEVNDVQREYLETIVESSHVLMSLMDDILDMSKIESGQFELSDFDFNFEYLVESAVKIVTPKINAQKVELVYEVNPDLPPQFRADANRIRQIIINLLGNSAKFTEKGHILLTVNGSPCEEMPDHWNISISVRDTGIGIPKDKQKEIFNPFVQLDASSTRGHGGAGLGLAIVKKIVEKMAGSVEVVSEPGKGTQFLVTLRLKGSQPLFQGIDPVSAAYVRGKTVVIVDGSRVSSSIMQLYVSREGMVVLGAFKYAEEALEWLDSRGQIPDIIISEIVLPGIDGYEFARGIRLRQMLKETRLMAITVEATPGISGKIKASGFDAYLAKPITRSEFIRTIRAALGINTSTPLLITRHLSEEVLLKGTKVLVAEDNKTNQRLLCVLLERLMCEVDTADNGQQALEKAKTDKYDLVLMDIQMPLIDGFEVTRQIRQAGLNDLPIIAITAATMKEDEEKAIACGMNDYMAKPIDRIRLKDKILKWARNFREKS